MARTRITRGRGRRTARSRSINEASASTSADAETHALTSTANIGESSSNPTAAASPINATVSPTVASPTVEPVDGNPVGNPENPDENPVENPDEIPVENPDENPVENPGEIPREHAQNAEAIRPFGFYFHPDLFNDYPKISTRCKPHIAFDIIDKIPEARRWILKHNQFKHIYHMKLHENRMCMGIWLLTLRIADTHDRSQCWFVVNGVPIRYSIREHGLLSGLHCHNYPDSLDNLGSMKFVKKHFGKKKPWVRDVLAKLNEMLDEVESRGRLKMAILYFLALVKGRQKDSDGPIEDFLLRVVDDLDLCKSFPWGRYTYLELLHEVYKMVDKQRFGITKSQCIPGFILPLEVLAFECIEPLRSKYREAVDPVEDGCPILCRGKFKKSACKGFSLSELYEQLGDSTDIRSTVVPVHEGEDAAHIAPQELDVGNPIVDVWNRIITGNGKIFWEDYRVIDVAARAVIPQVAEDEQTEPPIIVGGPPAQVNLEDVMKIIDQLDGMFQNLSAKVEGLNLQVCGLTARVRAIEDHISRENAEGPNDGEDAEAAKDGTKNDDGAKDGTKNDDGGNDGSDDDDDDEDEDGANDGTDVDDDEDGASDGSDDDDEDGANDGTDVDVGTSRKRTRSWYYKEPFADPVGKGKGTGAKRTKK